MTVSNACSEMDGLLAERASGPLAPEDAARLEAHLTSCRRCSAELALYERSFDLMREAKGEALPPDAGRLESAPGLASSTLALWKRSGRRRRAALALGSGFLAAAAAASLVLAPGLLGGRAPRPEAPEALAAWEPDVDGVFEASGLGGELTDDEQLTTEDVVLAAFDAAERP